MLAAITHFLSMSGYGYYIFSAYSLVLIILTIQLVIPLQRWRRHKSNTHE